MSDRTFEFLLNAMENAAQSWDPASAGYAANRQAVLDYVAGLQPRPGEYYQCSDCGVVVAMEPNDEPCSILRGDGGVNVVSCDGRYVPVPHLSGVAP